MSAFILIHISYSYVQINRRNEMKRIAGDVLPPKLLQIVPL
jgi:hypothetical protein